MKDEVLKIKGLARVSLTVLAVFLVNLSFCPSLATKAIAAEPAGAAGAAASSAGAGAGAGTVAGVTTGTIAAGVAVAAAAAMAVAASGGSDDVIASGPSAAMAVAASGGSDATIVSAPSAAEAASAAATALANADPVVASATASALSTLSTEALGKLAAASSALGAAGQESLALAASKLGANFSDVDKVISYMETGIVPLSDGARYPSAILPANLTLTDTQKEALRAMYLACTPAQLNALQDMYKSTVSADGQVDTTKLTLIASVVEKSAAGTPAEQAENMRQALLAILTARHPGANVVVTTVHHGNSVYSTVTHVSP